MAPIDPVRPHAAVSRRNFLQVAGLGAAGLAGLAACSSGTSSGGASSGAPSPSASSPASSGSGAAGSPSAGGAGSASTAASMSASKSAAASGGASPTTAAANYGELIFQLNWIKNIEFGGEYFADSKGFYRAAGFSKVDLLAGGSASNSPVAAVLANKALVAYSSPITTGAAIAQQKVPLKMIATVFQKAPFCITSLKEKTPITSLADLKGKKIGVQTGSNEVVWDGFLKANNIDPSELTKVPVQYDPTVLITGTVDGFMSFVDNEPILLKSKGYTPEVLLLADHGLELFTNSFLVTQQTLDTKRDLLKAFLVAEIRGWAEVVKDPAGSAKLAVQVYGKDQKLELGEQTQEATIQNTLISTDETKKNGLLTISDDLAAQTIKSLAAMGTTVTAEQLIDASLINEVYQENPSLKSL